MKKKGPRSIPDFSRKPPVKGAPVADPGATLHQRPRDVVVKPKATSSKSGRRGQ